MFRRFLTYTLRLVYNLANTIKMPLTFIVLQLFKIDLFSYN